MTYTTPKIFAQAKPSDTLNSTLLYSVPGGASAQVTLFVCNQSNSVEYFRIGLVPAGFTLATQRYIAFDTAITGNGIFSVASIGLSGGDTIWIRSSAGNLSFTATGMEFT